MEHLLSKPLANCIALTRKLSYLYKASLQRAAICFSLKFGGRPETSADLTSYLFLFWKSPRKYGVGFKPRCHVHRTQKGPRGFLHAAALLPPRALGS